MAVPLEWLVGLVFSFLLFQAVNFYRIRSKIANIPTVGSDHFFFAYIDAWRFVFKGQEMIKEGYRKYPGSAFKVPTFSTASGWLIVVSGTKLVEDIRKAPSDVLSFREASIEFMQSRHQLHHHAYDAPFHLPVIKTSLTRSFPSQFGEVSDEIRAAAQDHITCRNDWQAFDVHHLLIKMVARTSNRLFVGLPLCRDPEFLKIQETWTIYATLGANLLNASPQFLRPLIGAMMLPVHAGQKRTKEILCSVIQDRLEKFAEFGSDWDGKPNDLISWLVDDSPPKHRNVEDISFKVIFLNFAAIHTTSITGSNVLLDLAARQEYVAPLRAEIEQNIAQYGWSRDAMSHMRKLDSFIKESNRMSGLAGISMRRKAQKDFTFSNGVTIPTGFSVAVASYETHHDTENYEEAETFNGFRFSDMREDGTDDLDHIRHQMVSLDPSYLIFGYGRNACPGRFFAVNEIKAIVAHLILNYDIQLPEGKVAPPPPLWISGNRSPGRGAKVMLRKRRLE